MNDYINLQLCNEPNLMEPLIVKYMDELITWNAEFDRFIFIHELYDNHLCLKCT